MELAVAKELALFVVILEESIDKLEFDGLLFFEIFDRGIFKTYFKLDNPKIVKAMQNNRRKV